MTSTYEYAGSDNLDEVGWYSGNLEKGNSFGEKKTTHPVGQKKPNQLGLYDMSGNIWEWCQDMYGPYSCHKKTDIRIDSRLVLRGGSWDSDPESCRVASRFRAFNDNRDSFVGFRVARDY